MIRLIPRLDIKGPNLVKGVHLEGLRVLGKPEAFARFYYENGADELLYLDAVASLYGRNSLLPVIEKTTRDIFIPLTVGGGLRSIEDIQKVLRAGADKVVLNTAAVRSPDLVQEASRRFGSSTIVVGIDAIQQPSGNYEVFIEYGREKTGLDAMQWAVRAAELGAGELMITSVDREGTGKGFDIPLTRRISELVSIPVIAAGGAGSAQQIGDVIQEARVNAVAIASLLHYEAIRHIKIEASEFKEQGNIEFLKNLRTITRVQPQTIGQISGHLKSRGIPCRSLQGAAHA